VNWELNRANTLCVFLCGDVMTGRGIDQALPHPSDPTLFELCAQDARDYVQLAERANGPFIRPVGFKYIWGDALAQLSQAATDARIINLETSITQSNDCWPDKGIHYRMHPHNVGCLTAARIDACSLANNHVLDWGRAGLVETLDSLDRAGVKRAGAGRNAEEASAPAIMNVPGKGRVLLFAFGSATSGVFPTWAATQTKAGVNVLEKLSETAAIHVVSEMRRFKQSGDVVIASIHWGGNWGYEIPREQILFAHRLIEGGFDIIHGHSSHHVKGIEIFKERLILYGCGDFITDYEGISGYEEFRGDLSLMYLVTVDVQGRLMATRLVPMQTRQFQLHRASNSESAWLCALLNQLGTQFGTRVELADDNTLNLIC